MVYQQIAGRQQHNSSAEPRARLVPVVVKRKGQRSLSYSVVARNVLLKTKKSFGVLA